MDVNLKELIKYIAQALVDYPEEVNVSEIEGSTTSVIELKVAKDDLGKVIGKQGRTARAMRTILSAASTKFKKRAVRGEYTSGQRLPSVRDMAKNVGVNPNTIARVYMELEREGFIFTRRGQGSFITEDTDRLDEERIKLADAATGQFIRTIHELELYNGHRQKLIDTIKRKLSE